MSDTYIYKNNDLFSDEKIVEAITNWNLDDKALNTKEIIQNIYDRAKNLLESNPNKAETDYYILIPLFHQLGYMVSTEEPCPYSETTEEETNINYTLFENADSFTQAVPDRGTSKFFQNSLIIVTTCSTDTDLEAEEEIEDEDEDPNNISYKLNRCLMINAINWAICTNGRHWRLYHRSKANELDNYFEVDIISALASDHPDAWKLFYFFFRKEAFLYEEGSISSLEKLLD